MIKREQLPFRLLSHRIFLSGVALCAISLSSVAYAANRGAVIERIDDLEIQIDLLESQLRNVQNRPAAPVAGGPGVRAVPTQNAARYEIKTTELEEELRYLRGRLEELEHQQRRVAEQFELLQKEMNLRISDLEKRQPVAAPTIGDAGDQPPAAPVIGDEPEAPAATPAAPVAPAPVASAPEAPAAPVSDFDNARDHYNAAFKSLNMGQYDQAGTLFASFIKQYPKDPLISNAYYWLGETYYVRRDYAQAAERFREGFEASSEGPKAPDNLLKLGMSLRALGRTKEACIVYSQIMKKFAEDSQVIKRKAANESAKLQCE